ncbi:hypothetical protein [Desulfonema magnum]|uniref:hypothetical protein n=1 Tax=Desulfonema magnum TaxID=45655 RepID=UPI001A9C23CC|nr:hypothetical protein [Desulfonema magnum]
MEKILAISFPRFAWECSADASRPDFVRYPEREASRRHSHTNHGNEDVYEFSIC